MKMRQSWITPGALSLAVAIVASVVSGPPAIAQIAIQPSISAVQPAVTTTLSSTVASISTSSATTATRTIGLVPIAGTVIDAQESVTFHGMAQVSANVVTDPDFGGWPTAVISIDLSSLTGIGISTGNAYVGSGAAIVTRPLGAADTVQLTFPYFMRGDNAVSARVGMASFNLSFNVNTMKLTGATAHIDSPGP